MRCPAHADGSHHAVNEGWSHALDGEVHRCPCGYRDVFPTAEQIVRTR